MAVTCCLSCDANYPENLPRCPKCGKSVTEQLPVYFRLVSQETAAQMATVKAEQEVRLREECRRIEERVQQDVRNYARGIRIELYD
jgi:DNA-directed RNA polymerase subunit N (RpoN/RPB10)